MPWHQGLPFNTCRSFRHHLSAAQSLPCSSTRHARVLGKPFSPAIMEASSPLAALHRPMMPAPSWGGRDIFRPRPRSLYSSGSAVSGSFSLREQLHRGGADYFNVKDVRGSSPAASLAADLSQNFRLDNEARYAHLYPHAFVHAAYLNVCSPQFPTPRRALFTANVMAGMEHRRKDASPTWTLSLSRCLPMLTFNQNSLPRLPCPPLRRVQLP